MKGGARWDLVIIGAGMAGLATAIWARRLGMSALVLEREREAGGQLTAIGGRIVDYPGLDLPHGSALTTRLLEQAEAAGVELRLGEQVLAVDGAGLSCTTPAGQVRGRALVLATGLTPRRLQVPGEVELYREHLVRRPSHDLPWFRGRRVAVIGGGDRAAENALILLPVAEQVHLLYRSEGLRARSEFTGPLMAQPEITLYPATQVSRFQVTPTGVQVEATGPDQPLQLAVDAVCIYIGNRPKTELVAGQVELDGDGYLVTDRFGRSSLPGLYGVGDVCTQPAYQSLSTAAGQAMVVAKRISLDLG